MLGPHQAAVELVDPGVVGALEADGLAALALLDRGPPVAAHVVERADHVVAAADQEHALAQHVAHEEAAGLGDLLRAADREPVAEEVSSVSHAKMSSSWYALPGRSRAPRNGARILAISSGESGAGVRGARAA